MYACMLTKICCLLNNFYLFILDEIITEKILDKENLKTDFLNKDNIINVK